MQGETVVIRRRLLDVVSGAMAETIRDPAGILNWHQAQKQAFLQNPDRNEKNPVSQLVVVSAGVAIGKLDVMPGACVIEGHTHPIFWGSSLWVEPESRKSGAGRMLLQTWESLAPTVCGCGTSQPALRLYHALKWQDWPMERRMMLFSARPVVQKYLRSRRFSSIVAGPLNLGLMAFHTLARGTFKLRGLSVREIRPPVPSVIETFMALPTPCGFLRNRPHLDWMLGHSFSEGVLDQRRLWLIEDHGCAVGFFLLKLRHHKVASRLEFPDLLLASLLDWRWSFGEEVGTKEILMLAAQVAHSLGADALEVCCPTEEMAREASRLGFLRVGALHLVLKGANESPLNCLPASSRENWTLRPAEGDNAF